MRLNLIFIIICFLLHSCKKDRVCSCSAQVNYVASGATYQTSSQNITVTFKKVSKQTAKKNCITTKIKYDSSQDYVIQDCKLN